MDPEARFRAWLRSVDRVFVPPRTQIMATASDMGLTPGQTQHILDSEPELTRLKSGRVPKGRVAFRLRLWSQAEIDLGFLHLHNTAYGIFFLGITWAQTATLLGTPPDRRRIGPPSDPRACVPSVAGGGGGKTRPPP